MSEVIDWPVVGENVVIVRGRDVSWEGEDESHIGRQGMVRAVFKNAYGHSVAALELDDSSCYCFVVACLEPIRTAEQIAEEDREKWIQSFCNEVDVPHAIGARTFDKGYRKQADQ